MTQVAVVAQDLTAAGFVALGAATAYRWYRDRGRAQGTLALALIALGAAAALGRLPPSLPQSAAQIVAFILSGYFVLLFRNAFVPLGQTTLFGAYALLAVSILAGLLIVTVPAQTAERLVAALGFVVIFGWAIFTGEPVVRFWRASNDLPPVQKTRMRFLSFGFGVLIAIQLVDVLGGSTLRSATAIVITQLLSLAAVPFIYLSLAPPTLLRRIWRMSEEDAVRSAMQDLLIFSPTRKDLADRAIFWAVRMVGATSGFIAETNGKIIATAGMDRDRAEKLLADRNSADGGVVYAPLHLPEGSGTLAVVAGRFTPVFGTEEVAQLRAYANSVSAGMQRVAVTERLAAIEKNKTQFLNLASHELRGPVTVIRGYVSMLEGGLLGHLNDRGRSAAGVMASKISEMNELIEDMMEAARLEEGGVTMRAVDTDLREVARAAGETVRPMLGPRHKLVLDLPDRRVRVRVDPDRTRTIITNLLSNAIKYSPKGGEVTCHVRSRAGVARVSVIDHGLGIARENLPTLFTRFGRVMTPETEHLKGTGLGLFLARQLAQLQGGDITVASVEGKGSTFTLQLPAAGATDVTAGAGAATGSAGDAAPVADPLEAGAHPA